MKENRSQRFELRLTPSEKARWLGASSSRGYRSLALFVEDAVRAFINGGGDCAECACCGCDSPSPAVTPGQLQLPYIDTAVTLTPAASSTASTQTCPRVDHHRLGMYCKACHKVIGKGGK